jgi:hypothetical protein
MKYKLILKILGATTLILTDRHGNDLETTTETQDTVTKISTYITLPNKIIAHIPESQQPTDICLSGVWLGEVKFKNSALTKLFVYRHAYGEGKSLHWNWPGQVEFEFFEHSAIKYHLIMGSTV